MKDRKIKRYFFALHSKELKDFEQWLLAQYKCQESLPVKLWKILTQFRSRWNEQLIWKRFKPGQPFNERVFSKYASHIVSCLDIYLPLLQLKRAPYMNKLFLIREYVDRKLFRFFTQAYREFSMELSQNPIKDSNMYWIAFQLEIERHKYFLVNSAEKRTNNLISINKAFDEYWILQKLVLACHTISHSRKYNVIIPNHGIAEVIRLIDTTNIMEENGLVHIYRNLYRLLTRETDMDANKLIRHIDQYDDTFPFSEKHDLFGLMLNHYIFLLNTQTDKDELYTHILGLYDWARHQNLLNRAGYLIPEHFKNVIALLLRLDRIIEAELYFEKWQSYLSPQHLSDGFGDFVQGLILFKKRSFGKLKTLYNTRVFSNPFFELSVRKILIQVEYEQCYPSYRWELDRYDLMNKLKVFIRYIKNRKDLSFHHRHPLVNQAKLFLNMIRAKTAGVLVELAQEIRSTYPIDDPDWVLEKISQRLHREFGVDSVLAQGERYKKT